MTNYTVTFQRNGSNVQVHVQTQNGHSTARAIAEAQAPAGYQFASIRSN